MPGMETAFKLNSAATVGVVGVVLCVCVSWWFFCGGVEHVMHFFQTKAQIRCLFSNSKGVTSPEVLFNCIISNSVGCRKVVSQNENYYSGYSGYCIRFKRQSSLRCLWGNLFRFQQYGITILLCWGGRFQAGRNSTGCLGHSPPRHKAVTDICSTSFANISSPKSCLRVELASTESCSGP